MCTVTRVTDPQKQDPVEEVVAGSGNGSNGIACVTTQATTPSRLCYSCTVSLPTLYIDDMETKTCCVVVGGCE